jgi:hypothetical protein
MTMRGTLPGQPMSSRDSGNSAPPCTSPEYPSFTARLHWALSPVALTTDGGTAGSSVRLAAAAAETDYPPAASKRCATRGIRHVDASAWGRCSFRRPKKD